MVSRNSSTVTSIFNSLFTCFQPLFSFRRRVTETQNNENITEMETESPMPIDEEIALEAAADPTMEKLREIEFSIASLEKGIRKEIKDYAIGTKESEIEKVISTCEECQRRKNPSAYCHVLPMGKWEIPNRPFQRIHIDVMGPLSETIHGNKLIIVATDAFSKFAIAKATANQTAETTLKFLLENIVSIHGIPEEIVTDQGTNFMSKMFEEVCRILEVKHSISTAYHHETNGAVERLNRTLEEMLTLSTSNPINYDNWDEKLPLVIQSYNAGYHSSVKYSPEYIIFGRMTVSPTDIMIKTLRPIYRDEEDMVENLSESIRQCHEAVYGELENTLKNAKKAHDKIRKVRVPIFEVGEKVVIQNPTAKETHVPNFHRQSQLFH
ncbi:hypothetical protein CRE_31549 [Caenorhabditis remanei]|uniref:Integrase catalytic domain-containing protein n=1 Tax=Caenorhabditis remanei TaxID=31234 RepID=E3NK19_CAERE|nr:hypothetical protein CRE_31549 [Caenorhabditis remanei]